MVLRIFGFDFTSVKKAGSLAPSVRNITGRVNRKAFIVVIANWLPTEPMRSLRPFELISFAFSLPLIAANTFAREAVTNAPTAKLSSPSEAKHTPPMTGIKLSHFALLIFDL